MRSELYIRICTVFSMKIYYLARSQRHVSVIYVRIICYKANIKSLRRNWFVISQHRRSMPIYIFASASKINVELHQRNFESTRSNYVELRYEKEERCARVMRLRRPQYGLIIISDNSFHYADDQRGHVIRLPTVRQSIDRPGKRKWRIKKKKRKCALGNNNNKGRRHRQKYGAAGAARRATRQGSRCLMFKSAITRSFGDICHCRCQPATQSI